MKSIYDQNLPFGTYYTIIPQILNQSDKSSLRIEGAKGLKLSLNFILRFKFFCIEGDLGSAKIDLFPNALGPNSILPWNQPTIFWFAKASAVNLRIF